MLAGGLGELPVCTTFLLALFAVPEGWRLVSCFVREFEVCVLVVGGAREVLLVPSCAATDCADVVLRGWGENALEPQLCRPYGAIRFGARGGTGRLICGVCNLDVASW